MNQEHWEYFLSIEADLADCARYVDFSQDNFNTHSIEFARIIMTAGSEFDNVAKKLCAAIQKTGKPPGTLAEYRPVICGRYPRFPEYCVGIARYQLTIVPWADWSATSSPEWWSSGFNKIKHERDQHFRNANLKNALHAVCGLFTGLVYLHDAQNDEELRVNISEAPRLVDETPDPARPSFSSGGQAWTANPWK